MKEWFADELSDQELDTAELLVSELVTNAVIHGRGRITLRARLNGDRLLVEVIDEGSGLEAAVRERDFENPRAGGRGLRIVDAASSRWGMRKVSPAALAACCTGEACWRWPRPAGRGGWQ